MEDLTKYVDTSIENYFKSLSYKGYLNDRDTNNLLILTFLEEMLYYKFSDYITQKDYTIIMEALNELYNSSCILGNLEFKDYSELVFDIINHPIRSTEGGIIRFTEEGSVRTKL